ncbi:hypothetical protein KAT08_00195 [Candidatus Babeliales bacterium]|nr:hypothetical protein [Candidatus Babeliales bacterium]
MKKIIKIFIFVTSLILSFRISRNNINIGNNEISYLSYNQDGKSIAYGVNTLHAHKTNINSITSQKTNTKLNILLAGLLNLSTKKYDQAIYENIKNIYLKTTSIVFSPNKKIMAIAHGKILILNIEKKEIIKKLDVNIFDQEWIELLAFSPDGKFLISASGQGTIFILSTTDWSIIKIIKSRKDIHAKNCIYSYSKIITFDPNGKFLAIIFDYLPNCIQQKVCIYNTDTWEPIKEINHNLKYILNIGFSVDGTKLILSTKKSDGFDYIKIYDTIKFNEIKEISKIYMAGNYYQTTIRNDLKQIAFSQSNNIINIVDINKNEKIFKFYDALIAIKPDGNRIFFQFQT